MVVVGSAGTLGALAIAADPNDADPDPLFGDNGIAYIVDAGSKARGGLAAGSVDGYQASDGRIVMLTTRESIGLLARAAKAARTEPNGTGLGGLLRYTSAGVPDPDFNAGGSAGVSVDVPFAGEGFFTGSSLAVAPAPNGGATVVTAIYPQGDFRSVAPIGGSYVQLTRYESDGSLDDTFDSDGTKIVPLGGGCSDAVAARRRADGGFAIVSLFCVPGEDTADFNLSVISADGVVDDAASADVSTALTPAGQFNLQVNGLAFATVAGAPRTYVLLSGADGEPSPQTVVVALDATATPIAGFGTAGVASVPGRGFDIEATAAGEPVFTAMDASDDAEVNAVVTSDWRVHRFTVAGAPDSTFATAGELRLPEAARLPIEFTEPRELVIDEAGRGYIVSEGCDCTKEQGALVIARITPGGVLDAEFGPGGYRTYPLDPDGILLGTFNDQTAFTQTDGKLVVGARTGTSAAPPTRTGTGRAAAPPADPAAATLRLKGIVPTPTPTPSPEPTASPTPSPSPSPTAEPKPAATVAPTLVAGVRTCGSRRSFRIRLRPLGVKLVSAVVTVGGKKMAVSRRGSRLTALIVLRGLPRNTFTIKINARGADGFRYLENRRYRTCIGKRPGLNGENGKVRKLRG